MSDKPASINLSRLAEPFHQEDIEWRVSRAGQGNRGIWCQVLAYVTARAIEQRLDDVCGPAGWQLTQPVQFIHGQKCAMGVGISILVDGTWVTKWDVCELTDSSENIPPFKGGLSGAIKRAGAQWGIFRYGYYLEETYAEVRQDDPKLRGWHYARLPKNKGGTEYYWKEPTLPAWALPKDEEKGITVGELTALKKDWIAKFAADQKNKKELAEGFSRFVVGVVGEFPLADEKCWTQDALERCRKRISETTEPGGVSPDVPFE